MNDWDRDNLHFLVKCSSQEFKLWMEMMDEDDLFYALELIREAKDELLKESNSLVDSLIDFEVGDCSEAKSILSKFTLKG